MNTKKLLLAALISSTLAGCASTPETAGEVEALRSEYTMLSSRPDAVRSASLSLQEAEVVLEKAERAVERGADSKEIEHLTYITEKKLEIVKAKIAESEAEEYVANAELARKDFQIQRKEQELKQVQREKQLAIAAVQKMAAEADKLQSDLAEVKAKQSERGLVLTLSDILFETNNAEIASGAERSLSKIAEFLNKYPKQSIVVEGHTDSTGTSSYNQDLSERRAASVREKIVSKGVDGNRINSIGKGEEYPVASNDNSAGRQQNRRVEIVVKNNIDSNEANHTASK